jgi:UDP-N-acetyl-D-galactosamine dehydrogenase
MIVEQLITGQTRLAVIGLGYVGLPLALQLARHLPVTGFDVNGAKIDRMRRQEDPHGELPPDAFNGCNILFTTEEAELARASFFIVAVPTPVYNSHLPDLRLLQQACTTVGRYLRKGGYVVFEPTVYPGCTEEYCVPIIEATSGLRCGEDFSIGYSPERINPGDREHRLDNVVKVVAANNAPALEAIAAVYERVVHTGVYKAPSIKVAEAAKIVENTQRDVNIALMNELSVLFDTLNINTSEVLDAAGTKWNFLPFKPGLVGGHCIGVDPYYLAYKATSAGASSKLISTARHINDTMGHHLANRITRHLVTARGTAAGAKVLVMGVTFKENVRDIRNSKTVDVVRELQRFGVQTDLVDPLASREEFLQEYRLTLSDAPATGYDAVIITVPHRAYLDLDDAFFADITEPHALIADIKGLYRYRIHSRLYWSF